MIFDDFSIKFHDFSRIQGREILINGVAGSALLTETPVEDRSHPESAAARRGHVLLPKNPGTLDT